MDSKEYFEKVMQDYNQNRNGRSLRKYCKDEAVDYDRLIRDFVLSSPDGEQIELKSNSLFVVDKMTQP